MRQERTSLIRAVTGALPATSLLLLVGLGSLTARAADIPCPGSTTPDGLDIPAETFRVRIVDLARDASDESAPGLDSAAFREQRLRDPDLEDELAGLSPDLSSNGRSLAILREIFDEPVDGDVLDVARTPYEVAPTEPRAPRQPAVGVSDAEAPSPAADDADTPESDARLPGVSEEEAQRYRRQMYRTDI